MASLTERLERCYTGVVHDVMRGMGLRDFTLPPSLKPILPGKRLAGPAYTISGRVDITASAHETLLAWTGLLSKAPGDHVLVEQPNDSTVAHMGELSAETLSRKGVRGCVIDGGCRDVAFLQETGFQVYCRHFTPRDVVGHWLPDRFEDPVRIGDVTIRTGDLICADLDGVVVLPVEQAETIVDQAEEAMRTENLVRKAILEGMDPQEAYLKYGKF
ncbi:MAG: RraA family protein [Pseudomonadota bacterium]|nr:RraA family protein [Pseudomonadota bacterium]